MNVRDSDCLFRSLAAVWAKRKNPKVVCADGRFYKKTHEYNDKRIEGLRYMKKIDTQSNGY